MNVKTTSPLVSIIVPVYNMEVFVEECLKSILNNTYTNFELIIVNDGSTDNTLEIVSKFKDPRIQIINKENGGAASSRNVGLNIAKGEYIIFIDADDVITTDFIKLYVTYSLEYNADICYSGFLRFFEFTPKENSVPHKVTVYQKEGYFNTDAKRIVCTGKLFSKRLISKLRFKEGIVHEDEAFYTLLLKQDINNIVDIDKPLYFYRINPSSVTHIRNKKYYVDSANVFLERLAYFKEINCKNNIALKMCFDMLVRNLFNAKARYPLLKRFAYIRHYGYYLYHFSSPLITKIQGIIFMLVPLLTYWGLILKQKLVRIKNRD